VPAALHPTLSEFPPPANPTFQSQNAGTTQRPTARKEKQQYGNFIRSDDLYPAP